MGYCGIHGEYDSNYGCPDCRDAEERAANDRTETLERLDELRDAQKEAAYRVNNPGDYDCPFCRLVTLKYRASCCPKCQRDIDRTYWQEVDARKELARQQAEEKRRREAEEWKRNAPARLKAEQAEKKRAKIKALIPFYFGYALPTLSILSTAFHNGHSAAELLRDGLWIFIPGLNLIVMPHLLFNERNGFYWTILWIAVGALAFLAFRPQRK